MKKQKMLVSSQPKKTKINPNAMGFGVQSQEKHIREIGKEAVKLTRKKK